MALTVDIEKKMGNFKLRVDLEAEEETLALLGASGCGKSMTLKCIAGIEKPDRGKIVLNGHTLYDSEKRINLSVQERRTGLVFQNYALFPNMTVQQNVAAGARREKNAAKRAKLVQGFMESFDLVTQAEKYPSELSGGQQQRVALARVLVSDPDILLLDEPFSALDSHMRFQLEREVRQKLDSFGKTVLLVTHDRDEAYRMSNRVAVMQDGRIEIVGEKKAVFAAPGTKNSAILTGCKNISRAKALDETHLLALDWGVELYAPYIPKDLKYVGIRMHHIQEGTGENHFRCTVEEIIENPFSYTFLLRAAGGAGTFGWEVDKELWKLAHDRAADEEMPGDAKKPGSRIGVQALCGQTVTVSFPSNVILLLGE